MTTILVIVGMWIVAVGAFFALTRWPMGKTSANRATYWKKFEGK